MSELLTPFRREFLARSLMDIVKLAVAAGLASGFFFAFGFSVRVALGIVILVLFFLACLLLPPRKGD